MFRTLGAQRDLAEVDQARAHLEAIVPRRGDDIARGCRRCGHQAAHRRVSICRICWRAKPPRRSLKSPKRTPPWSSSFPRSATCACVAIAGCDAGVARALARAAAQGNSAYGEGLLLTETLGRDHDGPRFCTVVAARRADRRGHAPVPDVHRGQPRRDSSSAARASGAARPSSQSSARSLEPLLPGFVCASAAMNRVADQIQRLQGHNLTVLITGESGTGKDLVARAIHVGSPRSAAMFLPYNCTTTHAGSRRQPVVRPSARQLHRRNHRPAGPDPDGGRRNALSRRDWRPAARHPAEAAPVPRTGRGHARRRDAAAGGRRARACRDQRRPRAACRGRQVPGGPLLPALRHPDSCPPLRERREEIPHLSTFFLREACERLGKPDVHLSSVTLDLFDRCWWPGNVRQLRNEVQRAVAMSQPGGTIEPDQLSADLTALPAPASAGAGATAPRATAARNLATAVEDVEREVIGTALRRSSGNISETARVLGLTRRGLYLKMRRLGLDSVAADI